MYSGPLADELVDRTLYENTHTAELSTEARTSAGRAAFHQAGVLSRLTSVLDILKANCGNRPPDTRFVYTSTLGYVKTHSTAVKPSLSNPGVNTSLVSTESFTAPLSSESAPKRSFDMNIA